MNGRYPRLTMADVAARGPFHRSGNCIYIRCPVHGDRQSGFNVRVWTDAVSGEAHFKCYSHDCHPFAIKQALLGLSITYRVNPQDFMHDEADKAKRIKRAAEIWTESRKDLTDTIGLYYLQHWRGITIDIPPSIRFHPSLWHNQTKRFYPALVACITHPAYGLTVRGIQRIYLNPKTGNKISIGPDGMDNGLKARMNLGTCKGAAVRLAPAAETQGLAEGVESGLSLQQDKHLPTWVSLGKGNFSLVLAPETKKVVIGADHDLDGGGLKAARDARDYYQGEGYQATILYPRQPGHDFNDRLKR